MESHLMLSINGKTSKHQRQPCIPCICWFRQMESVECVVVEWRNMPNKCTFNISKFKIQNEYYMYLQLWFEYVVLENFSKLHHFQFFIFWILYSINEAIKMLECAFFRGYYYCFRSASSISHDDMIKIQHWNMGNKSNKKKTIPDTKHQQTQ